MALSRQWNQGKTGLSHPKRREHVFEWWRMHGNKAPKMRRKRISSQRK
jgi:hypothetical protein